MSGIICHSLNGMIEYLDLNDFLSGMICHSLNEMIEYIDLNDLRTVQDGILEEVYSSEN